MQSELQQWFAPGETRHNLAVVRALSMRPFRQTYEGCDLRTGEALFLKAVDTRPDPGNREVHRVWTEVEAAKLCRHDGLPRVIEVIESSEVPGLILVVEFVSGGTLESRMSNGLSIPPERFRSIGRQLGEILRALHGASIVHRDIKPDNIMLVSKPPCDVRVRLVDLGVAQLPGFSPKDQDKPTLVGTPLYMAPEQAVGQKADARSDVFALGTILFEMAAGRAPHRGSSLRELLLAKLEAPDDLVKTLLDKGVPERIAECVGRCLQANPALRPSIEEILSCLEEGKAA